MFICAYSTEKGNEKKRRRRSERGRSRELSEVRIPLSTSLIFLSLLPIVLTTTDPPAKKQKMSDTTASAIRVAIDLGYQDLMTDLVGHLSTTYSCFAHLCVCYVLYTMC